MIQIGEMVLDFSDPVVLAAAIGFGLFGLLLVMVFMGLRANGKSARAIQPLAQQMSYVNEAVKTLNESQHSLAGGLRSVSDAQVAAQATMINTLERRLEEVQRTMGDSLHGSAKRTAHSLGELQTRLATIDKAQNNIEKLSGDVLSLQDILSNKQTRGAFGEIQLNDIVSKALSPDSYAFQYTLSNGKRADCVVHLPNPPGPIVIDSKFPLEGYELLRAAQTQSEVTEAARRLKADVRKHIKDIAGKYIIEGETADGALMFLPSEAVYAELHANFPEVVREGFDARVWIVSPTTCMATLNTMRAVLKDSRMREQAGAIRKELGALYKDVERLGARVGNLDKHFAMASKDIEEIKISATKAGNRAHRLDRFDFDELASDGQADVLKLHPKGGK
ncbi:DNA recombination protein RmuC [Amylibacter marinus]|uniref:DNA recombination protein RmuC homolog n=1 Tax=Amylibacter marinus TaxID=1475483 RepID=A0ABQ5VWY9_9RHOB|nr:DNA recombination protein RmuC [Amylibacter marinus]GLQ35770.1 DNA recombination protein RmuC [Amylibacter marinus]